MARKAKNPVISKARFRAYRIEGDTPLMMHSPRCVDPTSPGALAMAEVVKARKRKGADIVALSQEMKVIEWRNGIYHSDAIGPYLKGGHLKAAMVEAAKADRMGAHVKRYVTVPLARIPVLYDGPRDIKGLLEYPDEYFIDQQPAGVQKNKVIRTRPIFHEWAIEFYVKYRADSMGEDALDEIMEGASWCGLGDGRAIDYGKFTVTNAWEPSRAETAKMRKAATG